MFYSEPSSYWGTPILRNLHIFKSSMIKPTGWKPNTRVVGFFEVFIWYSGVGWGGVITYMLRCCKFSCTFIYTSYVMLRCGKFSCTSIYIPTCYAAASSLAPSYVRHATLLQVLLHFHIYVMLRCCKFSCTSIHTYMLCKQKESSTCEDQRVKKKWRKKVAAAVVLTEIRQKMGAQKF